MGGSYSSDRRTEILYNLVGEKKVNFERTDIEKRRYAKEEIYTKNHHIDIFTYVDICDP